MQNESEIFNIRDFMDLSTRVSLVEKAILNIDKSLEEIRHEVQDMRIEFRSDTSNLKTEMNSEFKLLRKEMKSDFRWILTIIGGLAAIMAHGFHWI